MGNALETKRETAQSLQAMLMQWYQPGYLTHTKPNSMSIQIEWNI